MAMLRFPLIVAVVFIHTSIKGADNCASYLAIRNIFSSILCGEIAVPTFFFISGYLFFYQIQSLSCDVYLKKLKRRVQTLLIPYLFWNMVVLVAFWFAHKLLPQYISQDFNNVPSYTWVDYCRAFWDRPGVYPICYQFWFIRDLMVYCIVSPLIYWVIRHCSQYVCFAFLLIPFVYNDFIFYFCMGSYFSIRQIDVISFLQKFRYAYMPICLLSFVLQLFLEDEFWMHCFIWSGIPTVAYVAQALVLNGKKIPEWLTETSFWIYAVHGLPIVLLTTTVLPLFFRELSDLQCVILYLLSPLCLVGICIIIYHILKIFVPRFLSVIIGNRISAH